MVTLPVRVHGHENSPDRGLPGRAAAPRGKLQMVGRQVGRGLRLDSRAGRDRYRARRPRGGLSARPGVPTRVCRGGPRRARRARAEPPRRGPDAARAPQPPHGCAPEGPPLREVRRRHRLLGHSRAGGGTAGGVASRRPLRRGFRPLSRDLAGIARGDGGEGLGLPRRGLPALPAQGRGRSGRRRRANPRGPRRARAGRGA